MEWGEAKGRARAEWSRIRVGLGVERQRSAEYAAERGHARPPSPRAMPRKLTNSCVRLGHGAG